MQEKSGLIKELGIYYLYFLCSFMDKLVEKIKNVEIKTRMNLEFRKLLSEDFQKECEKIEINSIEMVDELKTFREIKINFCNRFIFEVNQMCKNKKFLIDAFRKNIFKDIKYLSFYFFGAILTSINVNIEGVIDLFISMVNDVIFKYDITTTLNLENIDISSSEINYDYITFDNNKDDSEDETTSFGLYQKVKGELNNKIFEFNSKIGYRFADGTIRPYVNELKDYSNKHILMLNDVADEFISCYFNMLQSEFLLKHVSDILNLKNMDNVNDYMERLEKDNFISLVDMEDMLKNE